MSGITAGKAAVFTIPPHVPFLDALAHGIVKRAGGDPLALAGVTVLLPTRRACRSLREAFLRTTGGQPLLLPRLMPLNDLDEDDALASGFTTPDLDPAEIPPPVAALKRQLLLARLIAATPDVAPRPDQAVLLAAELARFLDQAQTERIGLDRLAKLAPDEYAAHWQITLRFLALLTEHWPSILAEEGAVDPADHRNRVFAAQTAAWRARPPGPIIAAGSTGSIPATADLLAAIARLPEGCVVLPGLDQDLDDESWELLDDTHPQTGLKQLLAHIGISREAVTVWPEAAAPPPPRVRLVSEAFRPAAATHRWRDGAISAGAADDISRIDCPTPREEAETIALVMRESLERPGRTCALVTPDRRLAERVTTELARWRIDVDDFAGRALAQTPPGAFLRLLAEMAARRFAPVALLAACKHPLAGAGMDRAQFRGLTRAADLLLRGPLPPEGLDGLRALIATDVKARDELAPWLDSLERACGPFAALMRAPRVPLTALLEAHFSAAEAFAATPEIPGALQLWAGDAGEAAAAFAAELAESAGVLGEIAPEVYPALLDALMEGRVVRPRFGRHPRLFILGPLEARLQHFDVTILGGLNEGGWPAAAPADPWMSRPMRKTFGLQSHERRIGLAAHDIAQALCAPRVVLTRAVKVEGTPTVPSRWLRRLEQTLSTAGAAAATNTMMAAEQAQRLAWGAALNRPDAISPAAPPEPRPPVAARPRKLSVTEIERWMRDPYSIYARHILHLNALEPLEQDASLADYGTLLHGVFQAFITRYPSGPLPADAGAILHGLAREFFETKVIRPGVMAFWWPRFERIAGWFLAEEDARRLLIAQSYVEVRGETTLAAPQGPFILTARADRIDRLRDGSLAIIDYKTGTVPGSKEVLAGYAPQLPLEAVIAGAGGFAGVPGGRVGELAFWHLHGRRDGGEVVPVDGDLTQVAKEAREGVEGLIAAFDDPHTAYKARPNPDLAPTYSDYLHLARVKEWAGDEDGP